MRIALPLTALAFVLAAALPAASRALDLSPLSFGASAGSSTPTVADSRFTGDYDTGTSFDGTLRLDVAPSLRLTADVAHQRFDLLGPQVMIPELRVADRSPLTLTAALAGIEIHHGLPRHERLSAYADFAGGVAWLREGAARLIDMNGPSFTAGGARVVRPAVAAGLGVRLPTGLPFAALDLGWRSLWTTLDQGTLRTGALRAGLAFGL